MKKNNNIYLLLALLCVWCPLFMALFDKSKPAASTSLRNSNPQILTNWSDIQTAINQDHEFVDATAGQQSGEHTQVKFFAPIATPANAANKAWLYSKDVSAVTELHWEDESGNELQMTSGGDLFSSAGLTVTGTSTFNGSITLGAGDDLIGSATSDITFNTNKFTVAGATGNTLVAGTFTSTGVATLGDSSQMATSAAPTVDADLANKKYVDDQITAAIATKTYDSGWFSVSIGDTNVKTHNLGSIILHTQVLFAPDDGGSPDLTNVMSTYIHTDQGIDSGASVQDITTTQFTIQAGAANVAAEYNAGGDLIANASGHYRVIARRMD